MSQYRDMNREKLHAMIRNLPEREIEVVGERRRILGKVLQAFNGRLTTLPKRERDAMLSLLYEEITDAVFGFHHCLESAAFDKQRSQARTMEEGLQALRQFRTTTDELIRLYEVENQ